MIRRCLRLQFAFSDKPKKDSHNPTFAEKVKILNNMKPYIIPFINKNSMVTKCLLKSYLYLIFSKFCFFGGPLLLKQGINQLQNSASLGDPLLMFFGYGVCYSASVLFQSLRNVQIFKITSFALTETASKAYKHMLSLGPDFFFSGSQRHKLFNLYKAQTAIQQNLKAFTQYFLPIFLDIVLSSAMLLYYANSYFVLSFLGCYSIYSVFTIKYSDYRRVNIRKQRQSEKQMDFITSQTFSNYYNVKYFGKQGQQLQRYHKSLQKYYGFSMKTAQTLGFLNTAQRFIFGAGLTFNMILAAYYVQKGILSVGDLIMIQTLMLQFLNPLFFLGSMYRTFLDTFIEVKQLYQTMEKPANVTEGTKSLPQVQGNIVFKDVSFRYLQDSSHILNNINFQVQSGSFVAVIGESGSGKSTVLNLIFRLYDPHQGQILLDGENIQGLNFDFRKSITFVSQVPYLFNGTVLQNLQYAHPNSTQEEIEYYTKALGLHDVIMQLPQKYNTNVGEKGNIFSGGQKQRISLIRALLKKSPILLLDQPTSSLDSVSQKKVAQLLSEIKGCTRIMVTHRRSLLKYTDKVIEIPKI